jgi:hypothetical protein
MRFIGGVAALCCSEGKYESQNIEIFLGADSLHQSLARSSICTVF